MAHHSVTVLHLRASASVGGPEKQILGQAPWLERLGFRTLVVSFLQRSEGVALLERAAAFGIGGIGLNCRGPADLRPVRELTCHVAQHDIDILCAHDAKSALIGFLTARRAGVPFLAWSRGWTGETLRMRLYECVHRALLRRADMVVAVSRAQADRCRRAGVRDARLRVVPNATDASTPPPAVADLRAELGLPATSRLVISVGRLSREKGHRHLVSAAPAVLARHPDVSFILVGEGQERLRLERQIRRLGLEGRVLFAGFRESAAAVMPQGDLLVLPSLTEGLPNVILEAFVAGLPVVATDVGGVRELVRPGTGWLVPGQASLAPAIIEALGSAKEARRRAEAARTLVAAEYSFARQAELIAGAFREVLGLSAPRRDTGAPDPSPAADGVVRSP